MYSEFKRLRREVWNIGCVNFTNRMVNMNIPTDIYTMTNN
jgi:hypothetical protein